MSKKYLEINIHQPPDDVIYAIGNIIIRWTYTQQYMDNAIYKMLGINWKKGKWITAPLKYHSRMDILKSIGSNYFKDNEKLKKEFIKILTQINACYSLRNKIDHSIWFRFRTDSNSVIGVRGEKEISIMDTSQLMEIDKKIEKTVNIFVEFIEKNVSSPHP